MARKSEHAKRIDALSFVGMRKNPKKGEPPRNWWVVAPTGDYSRDCEVGEKLALEYLAFETADKGGPGNLQQIVADMPRRLTGVEIGFLTMVSYAAGAGMHRAREVSAYWERCRAKERRAT
ncbi:MAG: hypothetical protein IT539_13770 [Bradyrhizobiaceae bacterium]|nr:hypothetical protein [Bradyrhizobiaceae bacterium]